MKLSEANDKLKTISKIPFSQLFSTKDLQTIILNKEKTGQLLELDLGMKEKKCEFCGKPLNKSQYRQNKSYKSCPRCSVEDGKEHIYYNYPTEFGTTLLRSSSNSPEGAQSYCQTCRGSSSALHIGYKRCSEF